MCFHVKPIKEIMQDCHLFSLKGMAIRSVAIRMCFSRPLMYCYLCLLWCMILHSCSDRSSFQSSIMITTTWFSTRISDPFSSKSFSTYTNKEYTIYMGYDFGTPVWSITVLEHKWPLIVRLTIWLMQGLKAVFDVTLVLHHTNFSICYSPYKSQFVVHVGLNDVFLLLVGTSVSA